MIRKEVVIRVVLVVHQCFSLHLMSSKHGARIACTDYEGGVVACGVILDGDVGC